MADFKFKHNKNYFSPSQLKKLYISLGQFNSYLNRSHSASTQALDLGSIVHKLVLEPYDFDDTYIVFDDTELKESIGGARPTATKKYAEAVEEFKKNAGDKIIISKEDYDTANIINDKMKELNIIDTMFSDGEAESQIVGKTGEYYDQDFNGLCIIDYDTPFQSVDLKTTSKPLHKFRYDASEFGYDIQASLTHALNGKDFVFVVAQTVEPYDIGIFTCSEDFMERGRYKINQALSNYEMYNDEKSSQVLLYTL